MRVWKSPVVVVVTMTAAMLLAGVARADQWDKKTVVKLTEPLQVPGAVLSPGTYVFKLVASESNRHIVRIMKEDETEVIATFIAIPNYRLRPEGTELAFWEMPAGFPPALRAWFYPGDNFGQEIAYPKIEATRIAAVTTPAPPILEELPLGLPEIEVPVSEPPPRVAEAPPQVRAEAPTPPPAAEPAAAVPEPALPRTASPVPLIGLVGLVSLAAAVVVRALRDLA